MAADFPPAKAAPKNILTLNSGSSSLKFAACQAGVGGELLPLFQGAIDRIDLDQGSFSVADAQGSGEKSKTSVSLADHVAAISYLLKWVKERRNLEVAAMAHRVVQGGPHHTRSQRITPELLEELRQLVPIDPPHLPAAIAGIEAAIKFQGSALQVACFDTAFHRTMPPVAQTYALPRELTERLGIIRYGFHGLSYEFIRGELDRIAEGTGQGKVIIAHLGNGASMAALRDGRSVETTMGFTPAGGLVMSSRSGDLDPGVIVHLLRNGKMSPDELNDLLYKKSGLLGVSGLSSDMRDLLASDRPEAAEAVDLFCYHARKTIGALAAVLEGVETLVFTGGIGENAAPVRARICTGLSYLGLKLNASKNDENDTVISSSDSKVTVRVIKTNEELVMARHTLAILSQP